MIPRRVPPGSPDRLRVHGLFILSGRYRMSYDAYTHMLFANHYAENWFSLWETRWYAGFPVISYPPLTHQLIAIFVPFLGFDKAFALILWIVTAFYPLWRLCVQQKFYGKNLRILRGTGIGCSFAHLRNGPYLRSITVSNQHAHRSFRFCKPEPLFARRRNSTTSP